MASIWVCSIMCPTCCRVLRASSFICSIASCASYSTWSRAIRALYPRCLRAPRASRPICSHASNALCPMCLVPYVLSYHTCLVSYVLACPTYLVSFVFSCLSCYVLHVTRALCGLVPRYMSPFSLRTLLSRTLRTLCSNIPFCHLL